MGILSTSGTAIPTGAAGGDLTGSYPTPTIGALKVTDAKVSATAAIALTKLASTGYLGYISVQDQKSAGTNGGTSTSATYQTRVLNTEVIDTNNDCALASNQITLTAGTYEANISAPCYAGDHHKIRLRNVTAGTTVIVGSAEYALSGASAQTNRSLLTGRFTIAAAQALEVQHYIQTGFASIGLGAPTSATEVEVYAMVELRRVS